jgi:peroxiredoxin
VVIIEIFSMYCPFCQREAPEVNRLYGKIESTPGLKGKIKLLGIGAGNSSFEVEVFKKKYDIPFPLIPDNDFSIYNSLGKVRTPYFIGVKINPDGTNRIIYSELGALKGADRFLDLILERSGIRKRGEK